MVSQEKEPIICVRILDSVSMLVQVHEVAKWILLVLFLFVCCLFVVSIVVPNLKLSKQFLV